MFCRYLPRYCLSKHVFNYFVFLLKSVWQILTDIFNNESIIKVIIKEEEVEKVINLYIKYKLNKVNKKLILINIYILSIIVSKKNKISLYKKRNRIYIIYKI